MLQLGNFQFSVDGAAYQSLVHISEYRWAEQALIGTVSDMQYIGQSSEKITLDGIAYEQIARNIVFDTELRNMAATGKPYLLVSGEGDILGDWAITRLSIKKDTFYKSGVARKIIFTIELRKVSA